MGFDNTTTVVGNVTRDPELRFSQAGMAIAQFGLAWNRKRQDQEEEVSFFDVTCFRQLAENVADSIRKGARVVIYGTLQQRSWETDQGDRRSKVEILADDVAPSLKWATAEVTKNAPPRRGQLVRRRRPTRSQRRPARRQHRRRRRRWSTRQQRRQQRRRGAVLTAGHAASAADAARRRPVRGVFSGRRPAPAPDSSDGRRRLRRGSGRAACTAGRRVCSERRATLRVAAAGCTPTPISHL